MADGTKKVVLTNGEGGDRGIHDAGGNFVNIAPGESKEVELSEVELAAVKENGIFLLGGKAPKAEQADEPGPLDLNIEDLTAYVDGLQDPAEVQKLIDAETAGKSRSGALKALNDRMLALAGD